MFPDITKTIAIVGFAIAILLLILGAGYLMADKTARDAGYIKINNTSIKVETADTPELQYKGLSRREYICDNCGMLFLFPEPDVLRFVMREMNFPLDIIWIAGDTIVKIDKDLPPEGSEPQVIYTSDVPVDKVLEVNAGFSGQNDIKVGDRIKQ